MGNYRGLSVRRATINPAKGCYRYRTRTGFTPSKQNPTSHSDGELGRAGEYFFTKENYRELSVRRSTINTVGTFLPLSIALRFYTVDRNPTFNSDRKLWEITNYFSESELSDPNCSSFYHQSIESLLPFSNAPRFYTVETKSNIQP